MKKNIISKRNKRIINLDAKNNVRLQAYKKAIIDQASEEIKKIEEDIINLEKNKI